MISVVMPVYNAEKTLLEAVESVFSQTWSALELIVIDDGSTDRSLEILEGIGDPRLKILSIPNSGPSAARNQGIRRASGDFIAFIDADDRWLPTKLEVQKAALDENWRVGVAYCWTDYIDEKGRFVCTDRRVDFSGNVYREMLVHNFIDSGSNFMVRREALDKAGLFDESLPTIEDWDLYIRLSAHHRFICVPQVLMHYRISPDQLTSKVFVMESSYRRVVEGAFAAAPASLQHLKRRSEAHFFEYLSVKSTQGFPDRRRARNALGFFAASVGRYPPILFQLWRRPWVPKAVLKALLGLLPLDGARAGTGVNPGTGPKERP